MFEGTTIAGLVNALYHRLCSTQLEDLGWQISLIVINATNTSISGKNFLYRLLAIFECLLHICFLYLANYFLSNHFFHIPKHYADV